MVLKSKINGVGFTVIWKSTGNPSQPSLNGVTCIVTTPEVLQVFINGIDGIVVEVWTPSGKPVMSSVVVTSHSKVELLISVNNKMSSVSSPEQISWVKLELVMIGVCLKTNKKSSEPFPSQFPDTVTLMRYSPYSVKLIWG